MSNMPRSKRLFVRSALIAGSAVAMMTGAQTIAVLDQRQVTVQTAQAVSLAAPHTGTNSVTGTLGVIRLRRSDDDEGWFQTSANNGSSGYSPSSPSIVQQLPPISARSSR